MSASIRNLLVLYKNNVSGKIFMGKVVFLVLYISFLVGILIFVYKTRANIFGVLFLCVLLTGVAFYLFQYGALGSFTLKAFSTEANFVKEKVKEVKQDAEVINTLKKSIEKQANEIKHLVESVRKSEKDITEIRNNVFGIESDLVKVKRGIVEIQYLTYAGRNIFPNPYHDRIMKRLNDLLIIAIPDPRQRNIFIKELQKYTEQKRK